MKLWELIKKRYYQCGCSKLYSKCLPTLKKVMLGYAKSFSIYKNSYIV